MTPVRPGPVRYGVVAVIERDHRLLVIQRSMHVVAPGAFCFPGGGIEPGETEEAALMRELQEELRVDVRPLRRMWQSITPWNVHLAWWRAHLDDDAVIDPNEAEVAAVKWLTTVEIAQLPGLLESNHHFLAAMQRGEVSM